jgi:NAD(P)-dependent dehydrogenase (short-subunit alcohol dehydrogenase family)
MLLLRLAKIRIEIVHWYNNFYKFRKSIQMQKGGESKQIRKPQNQGKPGTQKKMDPKPVIDRPEKFNKLEGKVAIVTGGDSGIGAAVAVIFAKHGADVAISYLNESPDAEEVRSIIENQYGRKCLLFQGDLRKEKFCAKIINDTVKQFGKLDIVVNNAGTQTEQKSLEDITTEQLYETFETNIFSMFWVTKYALQHLKKGSSIINTTSVTAYRGSPSLIDYSSTKGAILTFTRSLAGNLAEKGSG